MDLESENSALESVEDNEKLVNSDALKLRSNGNGVFDDNDNGNEVAEVSVKSPPGVIAKSSASLPSPSLSPSPSPSPGGTKGYGLKKWRRIKRDVIKDGLSNLDGSKLLKRGLPNSAANPNRATQSSGGGLKQYSEGSVSSTNATARSPGNVVDLFAAIGDSGIGNVLGAGTAESENSEDRSSKSSTAASAPIPKMMYEMPAGKGFASHINRMRNLSGKNLGNSGQRVQAGKVRTETSKKLRGDVVKIEKTNSHSSMESDSRSSNFVFMQGINFATSNGRQSGRSRNNDGENSDEAQGCERQPSEELPGDSSRKNGGEFHDNFQEDFAADSSWGIKEERSDNNGPLSDQDSLFESILTLQSAEEALEKEIQKLREIGKEESTLDDLVKDASTEQLQFGDFGENFLDSSESEVLSLKQRLDLMETKLDGATALLKVKEAKIVELQESILGGRSPKVGTGCALELHQESYRDINIELEGLFKQKIEAEVEYLVISRTVQNLRVAVVDQITTLQEQRKDQARVLNRLGDAEVKAAMLKGEAVKLENYCEDIMAADETIKLKMSICKYASCFFIQLMLLLIILMFLILQFSPSHSEVVPT
nr:WPP domain-interacting protein 2 [Coffea arabica]XP_027061272.1 WPP domain-interacting protein 2 [Coffea arabica]XP_027061273.1 WPP domain-interacting protein 2 [Coffea arabica]